MKIIEYVTEENKKFYDFDTMLKVIGTNKSKLQREIKKNGILPGIKYNNKYLYQENSFFSLLEGFLNDRLKKEFNEEWTGKR